MIGRESSTNFKGNGKRRGAAFLAALFLCAEVFLAPGIRTMAAEAGAEQTGEFAMIRVEAQQEETDREALLDRINAIRREACEEGIDNPINGTPLTPADYVPMEWSGELEKIAALRAAESTIFQDHLRPDGTECFTAAPEGISYTMETLAWGFESAADALEGWYSEKPSYVNADGKPAGHYMALINPRNRFVGIAGISAQWQRNACAGSFGEYADAGSSEEPESSKEAGEVWMIRLRRDLLPEAVGRAAEVTARRIRRAAMF